MIAAWRALPGNLRGAGLVALAALLLTVEQVILRYASGDVAVATVVLARALAQLVVAGAVIATRGLALRSLRARRPALQFFRALASLTSWWLFYFSFRVLDFAVATTLNFTTAFFVAILAGPIMGERVGRWRWAATVIGFLGVVLVVRPGAAVDPVGIAAGLGSALCGVAIIFGNRALATSDGPETTMFWVGAVATLGALPAAFAFGAVPVGADLALVAIATLIGAAALWLILSGFRVGEASALAPVPYSGLVYATVLGWWLFGQIPDRWTLAGCVVIALAGIALARGEARKR
jgi:drug/metabolite transporter (DMT)-like permease